MCKEHSGLAAKQSNEESKVADSNSANENGIIAYKRQKCQSIIIDHKQARLDLKSIATPDLNEQRQTEK